MFQLSMDHSCFHPHFWHLYEINGVTVFYGLAELTLYVIDQSILPK